MRPAFPSIDLPIGRRIQVIGNSCSGKSTVGARLAHLLEVPFIELDALNWEPGWVSLSSADPAELQRRIREATLGDGWVVAGSYRNYSQRIFWPRLQCLVWLDLPVLLLVRRVIVRSWRRWRSKELLWGTNYERFWPQLMVWNQDESLVGWILSQHRRKRRDMLACMADPQWSHIHFIRLQSPGQIVAFAGSVERHLQEPRST
jgi:adenylate kinase family enzyme